MQPICCPYKQMHSGPAPCTSAIPNPPVLACAFIAPDWNEAGGLHLSAGLRSGKDFTSFSLAESMHETMRSPIIWVLRQANKQYDRLVVPTYLTSSSGVAAFRHRSVLRQFRLHDYFPIVPPRWPRTHLASADRRLQTSAVAELNASANQAMPSSRSHEASEVFAVIHSGGAPACRTGAAASHASEIFRTSWRS